MISTPINQGNNKPPCLCDHQLVTGLVLRVRSTIWYDKSEAWRFSVDEIVGKFKSCSWTKLEFAKNRPKSSLFFFKSCFLSLNVKFPRFLVQMSKWCYRSQCSWFCFLFSISRAVPRLDFYLIPYQYCMSHTQWSCVKKITAEAYSHFREPFWGNEIARSQVKLSHCKLQGRYPITRFQFLQISQHCINRRNQQIMQICSQ